MFNWNILEKLPTFWEMNSVCVFLWEIIKLIEKTVIWLIALTIVINEHHGVSCWSGLEIKWGQSVFTQGSSVKETSSFQSWPVLDKFPAKQPGWMQKSRSANTFDKEMHTSSTAHKTSSVCLWTGLYRISFLASFSQQNRLKPDALV